MDVVAEPRRSVVSIGRYFAQFSTLHVPVVSDVSLVFERSTTRLTSALRAWWRKATGVLFRLTRARAGGAHGDPPSSLRLSSCREVTRCPRRRRTALPRRLGWRHQAPGCAGAIARGPTERLGGTLTVFGRLRTSETSARAGRPPMALRRSPRLFSWPGKG